MSTPETNSNSGNTEIKRFGLQRKYLDLIRNGKKTVEGRLRSSKYQNITQGEILCFFDNDDEDQFVICEILKVTRYHSFTEMLLSEGMQNCLPGETDINAGAEIYRAFPDYANKEVELGAVAFQIKVVN